MYVGIFPNKTRLCKNPMCVGIFLHLVFPLPVFVSTLSCVEIFLKTVKHILDIIIACAFNRKDAQ